MSQNIFEIHLTQFAGLWVWHILSTQSHACSAVFSALEGFHSRDDAERDAQAALLTFHTESALSI